MLPQHLPPVYRLSWSAVWSHRPDYAHATYERSWSSLTKPCQKCETFTSLPLVHNYRKVKLTPFLVRDVICMRRASSRSCAVECALLPWNALLSSRFWEKCHGHDTHFGCTDLSFLYTVRSIWCWDQKKKGTGKAAQCYLPWKAPPLGNRRVEYRLLKF